MGQYNLLSHIRNLEIMKVKEYTNIQDFIKIKKTRPKKTIRKKMIFF